MRGKREIAVSVVSIAVIGKAVFCNYRAQGSGIEGEQKRPQYRALRDTSFKRARFTLDSIHIIIKATVIQTKFDIQY